MAGYMTTLQSNVFKGTLTNGAAAAVENGTLMVLGTDGTTLVLPAADTTSKFTCLEKTTLYDGIEAYLVNATTLAKQYYFVENQFEVNDSEAYDTTAYTTAKGAYLRAHPILPGDEFIVTVPAALTVGTAYGVTAAGKIG